MLNEIHIEGVIAARWRYGEVEFLRIAVYSDPGRGGRRGDGSGRDRPDYVTLRCEGLHALAVAGLREGDRVRAAGLLTSREYEIPLAAFLRKARGDGGVLEVLRSQVADRGDGVAMPHVINEVLVERLAVLQRGERAETPTGPGREHRGRGAGSSSVPAGPAQLTPAVG